MNGYDIRGEFRWFNGPVRPSPLVIPRDPVDLDVLSVLTNMKQQLWITRIRF